MKVSYRDSMAKRIKYICICGVLCILGVAGYFTIGSNYTKYRIAFVGVSCLFGVILIMQIFHVCELVTLNKKGVEFFDEESAEFSEEDEIKEQREKLYAEDYEYGKGDEDFEFLLKDGEYTYDTSDDIFCSESEEHLTVENQEEKEYCLNCGEEINEDDDYCPKCGHSFDGNNTNNIL